MHSADYAVAKCPSVRLSHAGILSKRVNEGILTQSDSHIILLFPAKRYGNFPTGPLTGGGRQMQYGYEKIAIFNQNLAISRKWYKIGYDHGY